MVDETGSTAHWYFEDVMRCSMVSLHVGFNLYIYIFIFYIDNVMFIESLV